MLVRHGELVLKEAKKAVERVGAAGGPSEPRLA